MALRLRRGEGQGPGTRKKKRKVPLSAKIACIGCRSVMSEMNPTLCQTAQTPKPLVRTVPTNNNVIIVCFSDIVFRFRGRKNEKGKRSLPFVTTICLSILAQVSWAISFSIVFTILNSTLLLFTIQNSPYAIKEGAEN